MLMFTPKGYMSVSHFQGIGTWFSPYTLKMTWQC